ncbi:MAG: hypothetical protein HYY13_13645 [Nitrospirae bacterium]|nr:hypothetical protein [Nitrospirota bacterium]
MSIISPDKLCPRLPGSPAPLLPRRPALGFATLLLTAYCSLLTFCAPPAHAFTSSMPSNLLRRGEGMLGVEGGILGERLSVTGSFGTGAARTPYDVEGTVIAGVGGYGFTERMDAFLKIGGVLSPSVLDDDRATGLLAGAGLRYSLAGSRSAEVGLFTEFDYVTSLVQDTPLTIGNVRASGRMELRDMVGLTLGIGPQWWWQIGPRKFVFPGFYVFVSPRFVGDGFYTQKLATSGGQQSTEQKLSDVDAQARHLIGVGGNVGLDLRVLILKLGIRWFGAFGGSAGLEVPF